jgi:hypothetical protein
MRVASAGRFRGYNGQRILEAMDSRRIARGDTDVQDIA